jgi:hypothetical protein
MTESHAPRTRPHNLNDHLMPLALGPQPHVFRFLLAVLYVDPDWSYMEFLNAASQRLELVPSANRVYNQNGVEVSDTMMVADDDMLYFSLGEAFIPPKMARDTGDAGAGPGPSGGASGSQRRKDSVRRGSLTSLGPFLIGEVGTPHSTRPPHSLHRTLLSSPSRSLSHPHPPVPRAGCHNRCSGAGASARCGWASTNSTAKKSP